MGCPGAGKTRRRNVSAIIIADSFSARKLKMANLEKTDLLIDMHNAPDYNVSAIIRQQIETGG